MWPNIVSSPSYITPFVTVASCQSSKRKYTSAGRSSYSNKYVVSFSVRFKILWKKSSITITPFLLFPGISSGLHSPRKRSGNAAYDSSNHPPNCWYCFLVTNMTNPGPKSWSIENISSCPKHSDPSPTFANAIPSSFVSGYSCILSFTTMTSALPYCSK